MDYNPRMTIEFKLPELGENIESGDVVNVLVREGDAIRPGQSVLEVETGKAVVELPCPHAGRVAKVHVAKGAKVQVGQLLLSLEASVAGAAAVSAVPDASPPAPTQSVSAQPTPARSAPAEPPTQRPAVEPAAPPTRRPATHTRPSAEPARAAGTAAKLPPAGPATRRLARELGVDLGSVLGSGPGGRVTEEDVKAAVRKSTAAAPAPGMVRAAPLPDGTPDRDKWGPIRRQRLTAIRKAIAQNMERSAQTIPHVTNFDDADITELERIRKGGLVDYVDSSVKLTMLSFLIKAVANSLRLHPLLNASLDAPSEELIYKDYVHLGVAVDTERGLVVPCLRDVDRMSIPRIAQALTSLAERARAGQLTLEEMQGSTFTISNLGAVGGSYSTPIINPPNVAILLCGRSRRAPVVVEERIEPRLLMPLSLSYDHRVVDGAAAARFLNEVIHYLTVPGRLLLAP